ncbi:MAG TPA: adenylate/guanylate cyclase domain-containing protein [Verrucomicrobiae bacterium]|nr:adenylate/guanylate cyclase domain-containing protein [Verrucomicrobiae bacterium]
MAEVEFIEGHRSVVVRCPDLGQTLLEASLAAGIPHYHTCEGQARCSTCRVLVLDGGDALGPRSELEDELARMRGWPDAIRLACQARPSGAARVRRVVNDEVDVDLACRECVGWPSAEERELGLLFCDIRDFTAITEQQLAYDVVHSLNRFFRQVGDPIIANGGTINKYMGDGLLALFGIGGESREACCIRAARAGVEMLAAASALNVYLEEHFGFSFRPRIGLHFGRVLVGQLGHPSRMDFTVVGDAVNAASRIEASNKAHGTDMLASGELVEPIRGLVHVGRVFDGRLRGMRQRVVLHEILGVGDAPTCG